MRNRNNLTRAKHLVVVLLVCLVGLAVSAQQPGTPPEGQEKTPSSAPAAAAGENPSAPASSEVVLKVGGTQITQSEIESTFPMRPSGVGQKLSPEGRRRVAETLVRMILLSRQAVHDHLDASPDLRFKLEMLRIRALAQAELDTMRSQIQVTSDEIRKYYNDHPSEFDTVQLREFLVRKCSTAADAGSSGLSPEEAKATAESIRKKLASGDSPDKIAEDFSGPDVLLIDRKPRTLRRDELTPALQKAVFEAKDGTIPEAVDAPDAVLVVDVLQRRHVEENQAAAEIEKKLRQSKLDARIDDMKKEVEVWMDDSYFKDAPGSAAVSTAQPSASDPSAAPNRE